ncbi:tyrosine-type recombinase/integrase [Altererythrobacter arenosus]|uniref:Tyrosine-type recombinase/integrase n=1 Tax=Altererythrobacter arenosus TaxID=3032592 RepID=A0ABY8FPD1_9SPHN|nr:site-specific integrase [Altererythrobacter sp. CAU 1644]WFL76869.1 tyrosine-type recombinase/integrase [Altererythrobacter sp. CAU 1644]
MATISKRKDSWFVQVRRKGFTPRYRSFASKSEAETWAREQETKIDTRQASRVRPEVLQSTLGELIERYKTSVTPKKRSYESEHLRLTKMQRHPICSLSIGQVSQAAVSAYRDDRLQEAKPGTVRRELSLLHHVFDTAQKQWGIYLGGNPTEDVIQPKVRDQRSRRLSPAEQVRLEQALSTCRNAQVKLVVQFALETAMRRGEILSLRWENINLEQRSAHIAQTKTDTPRTIPLSAKATAILQEVDRYDDCVFTLTVDALKAAWKRAKRRADIHDLRFHDLRHEAISRLFELGLNIPEVALISGHKDPRMLFRYTHLSPDVVRRRMDQLLAN